MEVFENIVTRRSVKKYKSDPVAKELVEKIVQAGICAPSGLNKQSPIVLAVTNKQVRDELSRLNARKDPFSRVDPFYGAPVVLVVLADKSVPTYVYDGSLTLGNMMLAAEELGLGSCWIHRAKEVMALPEWQEWIRSLGLEGEYEGIGNLAVGYSDGYSPAKKEIREGRVVYVEDN